MTQDYEPIKITENTPEPTDYGLYIAQYDSGEFKFFELCQFALGDGEFTDYWATIDDGDDYSWEEVREELNGGTIQSLAAHDAEVRGKALSLTDDELIIAESEYESYIGEYEGDGLGAMSVAVQAIIKHRREQKQ